jgi:TRAP-type C4-dicarboxylate transport system permease small subunit
MKLSRFEQRLIQAGIVVASAAALVMMIVGAGDAVFSFFGHPISGALELAELLMVLVVFLALPDAEANRKHIAIDLLTSRMPKSTAVPLAVLGAVLSLAFYGAMAWQSWRLFADSWAIREYTAGLVKFPVFPAKALFAIGITIVTAIAARNVVRVFAGPPDAVRNPNIID